jgi:hypothetical protein
MSEDWINAIVTAVSIIVLIGLFTNGFGIFDRTYKGSWVKVRYDNLPVAMNNLDKVNAFMDSDGMTTHLEMRVVSIARLGKTDVEYEIKIPKHVFHRVEFETVLKELGIK